MAYLYSRMRADLLHALAGNLEGLEDIVYKELTRQSNKLDTIDDIAEVFVKSSEWIATAIRKHLGVEGDKWAN